MFHFIGGDWVCEGEDRGEVEVQGRNLLTN